MQLKQASQFGGGMQWAIIIDSGSTVDTFCNADFLLDIKVAKIFKDLHTNGGKGMLNLDPILQ